MDGLSLISRDKQIGFAWGVPILLIFDPKILKISKNFNIRYFFLFFFFFHFLQVKRLYILHVQVFVMI